MTNLRMITLDERPDLVDATDDIVGAGWPEFMLHDPIADEHFGYLYSDLGAFQFVLVDADENVVALGNTVPLVWDGTVEGLSPRGWDWAMESGVIGHQKGVPANAMSAIQAVVAQDHLGKGLSQEILKGMKSIAIKHGLKLLAPVRPNQKHRYPLTSMERYVQWTHDEYGAPFDAWMRTHWKLGARVLRVCPESMIITAPVAEWEEWTEMRFPENGSYIVPGALAPLEIDGDNGRYVEPNVWMLHTSE